MNPDRAAELVSQAAEAVRNESFAEAISLATQAIEESPDSPDAHSILGIAYSGLGNLNDAEAALQKSATLRPGAAAHYNLASHYFATGNLEYAANHARAALSYDPGHEAAAALLRSIGWQSRPRTSIAEAPPRFRFVSDLGWSWTVLGCFFVIAYVVSRAVLTVRLSEILPADASSMAESELLSLFVDWFSGNASLMIGAIVWLMLMSAWWIIDNSHWRKSNVLALVIIGMLDAVLLMCCTYGLGLVVTFTLYLVLTRRPMPVV